MAAPVPVKLATCGCVRRLVTSSSRSKQVHHFPILGVTIPGQRHPHFSREISVLSERDAGSSASDLEDLFKGLDNGQFRSYAGEPLSSAGDVNMNTVIAEQGRIIEEKIAVYQKEAAEKAATLAYLQQGRDSEHKELLDTRAALEQALLQMEVLSQQAQVVDLLQQRINEQDYALRSLRTALNESNARRAMDTEATLANITELEEALALAQEQIERQPEMGMLEFKMEQAVQHQQELETEISSLRAQLVLISKAKTKAELDADRAWGEAKEKEAKLQKTLEQYNQLSAELTRMKRSSSRKKKGFLLLPSSDDVDEKLKQVQNDLAAANQAVQEKESSYQAATDELAIVKLQFSKQEERLQQALQELQELQTQLKEAQAAAAAASAPTTIITTPETTSEVTEKLQAQLKDVQKEASQLRLTKDKLTDEVSELKKQLTASRKELVENADRLRKASKAEVEKLQAQLTQERGVMEEEVQQLKQDAEETQRKLLTEKQLLQEETQQLKSKLTELEVVKQKLASKDEQLHDLEKQLASSAQLDREKMSQISQLLSEQKAAQQQVLDQQRAATDMQSKLLKRQQELDVQSLEVAQLKRALDDARTENSTLSKKLEQRVKDLEVLKKNDAERANQLSQATSVTSQLTKELQLVKANLLTREQEVLSLQQQNPSQQRLLANAYEAQQQLETQLLQAQQENDQLQQQISQMYAQLEEVGTTGVALEELLSLRDTLVSETQATSELLIKAEKFANAVTQQVRQGAAVRQQEDANAQTLQLAMKLEGLEEELTAKAQAAEQATQRVQQLEEEMYWMSQEYSRLQSRLVDGEGAAPAGPSALEIEAGLLEEVAEAKNQAMSAQAQAAALQQRVKTLEAELERKQKENAETLATLEGAVRGDDKLSNALSRIAQLEEENNRLQAAAARREAVLNQSKKFIEQYLERSAQLFSKDQPSVEATPATINGSTASPPSPTPPPPARVKPAAKPPPTPATTSTRR